MAQKGTPYSASLPFRLVRRSVLTLAFIMVGLTLVLAWPLVSQRFHHDSQAASDGQPSSLVGSSAASEGFASATPSPTLTLTFEQLPPSSTGGEEPAAGPAGSAPALAPGGKLPSLDGLKEGLVILAITEGGYSHLFAYQPQVLPFTRLTSGEWNDITPALSPDGQRLAFASNRGGYWDLYVMDLSTGEATNLTQTPEYDAHPTWSPDGLWLAYETYTGGEEGTLDVVIRPVDGSQAPLELAGGAPSDFAPAWSPKGRQIAFVSNRSGENEIWLADLDRIDDRFINLSRNMYTSETQPAWSPDGAHLAWSSSGSEGVQQLMVLDAGQPDARPAYTGSGEWPAWSPDGDGLLASFRSPNRTYLTGYDGEADGLLLPPTALAGKVNGIAWGRARLPGNLPAPLQQAAQITPVPLWQPALAPAEDLPAGRQRLVPLEGVEAPNPMLQDLVDESFAALRARLAALTGWDFLATLENAYVPLTSSLPPGMNEDWLYTGRAFAFNPSAMNAGWLAVVKEDFGPQTYWRIYLRTRFQDGSLGEPLHDLPWNLTARYGGDARAFEMGGALSTAVPAGYWLDFTELAAAYGWERLPALSTWRSAYSAARFNEFVLADGHDWLSAMLEVYPHEAIDTPTPLPPPTETPTPTLRPTKTPVYTRTPRPSATPRPSRTPSPTPSPTRERGS